MKILAVETTESIGSLAVLHGSDLLLEHRLDETRRSARSLVPGMREILSEVGWRPRDVELVAVARGPGSFTGLRVGITAAKTFAYAVGCQVLGLDTLECIAWGCPDTVREVVIAIDAQRGDVVARRFRRDDEGIMVVDGPERLIAWETLLAETPRDVPVGGPVLGRKHFEPPTGRALLEPEFWCPRASDVGRLAWHKHRLGTRDDVFSLSPRYSRPSAAEERRASAGVGCK